MIGEGEATADAATRGAMLVAGIVAMLSILLFVATGGTILSAVVARLNGGGGKLDLTLLTAMLLNIAIILFAWQRHRTLARALDLLSAAGRRAEQLAARDALTGLLNRRGLAEEAAAALAQANKAGRPVAMLLLDLDHFKGVNDIHGHASGDALLKLISAEMAGQLPAGTLVARLGGDEFAAALPFDPDQAGEVERHAEALVARLTRPFHADGVQLHVGGSIGLARSDRDGTTVEALMRAADIAMYAAKSGGRSRYSWFEPAMERALQARNDMENGLRRAIPNGEIVPFFEQQVDLVTGRLVGFEVLARWEHPTKGLVLPESFIGVAEETGLIGDLSLVLLRQACAAARDWDGALTIALNISPHQLRDPWLAQKIIKVLAETGFPASRLEIEITESALFANLPLAQSIVASLKNQGIRIALDDFGTGYSSLAHLRALPFDRIKIDRSFVSSLISNGESAAIVTAIAGLGESLNLPTTAEGIEDRSVEERLRGLGCDRGQGYLYGRPVDAAGVRRLLAERRLLGGAGEPRRLAG